jgi:hypothetical protein
MLLQLLRNSWRAPWLFGLWECHCERALELICGLFFLLFTSYVDPQDLHFHQLILVYM